MTVDARILKSAAEGVSVCEIAAEHGMGESEVLAVLDREAEQRFSGESLRRELLLEAERLSRLEEHYYNRAMGDGEGATTAGGLYVKLAERRAVLLGLNAPVANASVTIHQSVESNKVTSTERIRAAIERLRLSKPNGEAPQPS